MAVIRDTCIEKLVRRKPERVYVNTTCKYLAGGLLMASRYVYPHRACRVPTRGKQPFPYAKLPPCLLARPAALPVCRVTGNLFYLLRTENNRTYIAWCVGKSV